MQFYLNPLRRVGRQDAWTEAREYDFGHRTRNSRISGWAGAKARTCPREFGTGGGMNSAANTSTGSELRVGGVDDGVHVKGRDVDELCGETELEAGQAQELRRQPRANPTPSSTPTPASAQIRTGVTGVWKFAAATGAATTNPIIPPIRPLERSAGASHWNLEASPTAAVTPNIPPTVAPTKSPDFPAAFPSIEPITAPRPASIHAARKIGRVFNAFTVTTAILPQTQDLCDEDSLTLDVRLAISRELSRQSLLQLPITACRVGVRTQIVSKREIVTPELPLFRHQMDVVGARLTAAKKLVAGNPAIAAMLVPC